MTDAPTMALQLEGQKQQQQQQQPPPPPLSEAPPAKASSSEAEEAMSSSAENDENSAPGQHQVQAQPQAQASLRSRTLQPFLRLTQVRVESHMWSSGRQLTDPLEGARPSRKKRIQSGGWRDFIT